MCSIRRSPCAGASSWQAGRPLPFPGSMRSAAEKARENSRPSQPSTPPPMPEPDSASKPSARTAGMVERPRATVPTSAIRNCWSCVAEPAAKPVDSIVFHIGQAPPSLSGNRIFHLRLRRSLQRCTHYDGLITSSNPFLTCKNVHIRPELLRKLLRLSGVARPLSKKHHKTPRSTSSRAVGLSMLLVDDPDQPFLDDGTDQLSVPRVDHSACQTTRALRAHGLLRVQQPFVGTERAVEPHRVVKTGHGHFREGPPVPQQHGVQQGQVRGIGHQTHL